MSERVKSASPRWRDPLAAFVLATVVGALFTTYRYFDDLARQIPGTLGARTIEEMTGAYTAVVLVPFIMALARRFPWSRGAWLRVGTIQLLGAAVFSLAHTSLMAITRVVIFAALAHESYDYGLMRYRYPMEFWHDVIVYGVIVGFIYFAARVRLGQERELAASQLQAQLAQAQLRNLRLQLSPHFLFNTLNAISAVMYENLRAADSMIARLSDYLRHVLNASEAEETSLDEEFRATQLYLEIMRARFEASLQMTCTRAPGTADALVPSMILQPLVENAIKHGMPHGSTTLEIAIDALRDGESVVIRIGDTGCGFGKDALAALGRGLRNTRARLEQLYGAAGSLDVGNVSGGASVTLRFPYRTATSV